MKNQKLLQNEWKLSKICKNLQKCAFFQIFSWDFPIWVAWLGLKKVKWQSSSNLKSKTIFPTSSLSWFQKCQNFWKKLIFWKKNALENLYGFINRQIFFALKAVFIECMIRFEFEKNCPICFWMNFWIRVPKNVENLIHHMGAQVGASRFEFSIRFWVCRC